MIKARFETQNGPDLVVFALSTAQIELLLAGDVLLFDGDTLHTHKYHDPAMTADVQLCMAHADDVATVYARVHDALGFDYGTS